MNRGLRSGCEDTGLLENALAAKSVRGTEDAAEISMDALKGECTGNRGVLFRSVALRRTALSIEDSNEAKNID